MKNINGLQPASKKHSRDIKASISKVFIITGLILIIFFFVFSLMDYPAYFIGNKDVNSIELPDPTLPDIDFVKYKSVSIMDEDNVNPAAKNPTALPGELPDNLQVDLPDELPDTPQTEQQSINNLDINTYDNDDPANDTPAVQNQESNISKYVLLGNVKIARINISENLFEGTGKQMSYGIGHVEETVMPGEKGNCAIAAHRVSTFGRQPFRYLDKLKNGDRIKVGFSDKVFEYEVFDIFIVDKRDVWVLNPVEGEDYVLTLITCDPVITATERTNRLIIWAKLVIE